MNNLPNNSPNNLAKKTNKDNIAVLLSQLQQKLSSNEHTQLLNDIIDKITTILNNFIKNGTGTLSQNDKDNLNILTALLSRELKKAQNNNQKTDKQILGILEGIIDEIKTLKNNSIRLKTLGEIVSTIRGIPIQPIEQ